MSAEWAGVIVSALGTIAGIWVQVWLATRTTESTRRPMPPPVTPLGSVPYPNAISRPPISGPPWTDLSRRAQKQLTKATVVVPITTLVYGLVGLRIGFVTVGILPAAIVALLFTTVLTPLIVSIGTRSRRAIRAAAIICNFMESIFLAATCLFLYFMLTALLHAFGLNWPPANFDNLGLAAVLGGILSALSAVAWYVTRDSEDLLNRLRREVGN